MKKYTFSFKKTKKMQGHDGLAYNTELYLNGKLYGALQNDGMGGYSFLEKNYKSDNFPELDESKINFMARQVEKRLNEPDWMIEYSTAETLFFFFIDVFAFVKKIIKHQKTKCEKMKIPEWMSHYALTLTEKGEMATHAFSIGNDALVDSEYKCVLRFDNEKDFIDKYMTLTLDEKEYDEYVAEKERQKEEKRANEEKQKQEYLSSLEEFDLNLNIKIKGKNKNQIEDKIIEMIKIKFQKELISCVFGEKNDEIE